MDMMLNIDDENEQSLPLEDCCCTKMKDVLTCNKYDLLYDSSVIRCLRRDGGVWWYWSYCPFCGCAINAKNK